MCGRGRFEGRGKREGQKQSNREEETQRQAERERERGDMMHNTCGRDVAGVDTQCVWSKSDNSTV